MKNGVFVFLCCNRVMRLSCSKPYVIGTIYYLTGLYVKYKMLHPQLPSSCIAALSYKILPCMMKDSDVV